MILQRPDLLWLVWAALAGLALAFGLHLRRRRRVVRALGGPGPAVRLLGVDVARLPLERYLPVAVAGGALALAGAGPRDPDPPPLEPSRPVDVVVALDLSRSMEATDSDPTRLERARALVHALLEALPADAVGLVGYAHEAYVVAPPTVDHDVVRYFLDALEADLVPRGDQGSRPGEALALAGDVLARRGRPDAHHAVVLVSDGEGHEEEAGVLDRARGLAESGVRVLTVGVGTAEGVALQRYDYRGQPAGPLTGPSGEPVVSRLQADFLRELAGAGDGSYRADGDQAVTGVLEALGRRPPGSRELPTSGRDIPHRLGLLALALLLAESGLDAVARRPRRRQRVPAA